MLWLHHATLAQRATKVSVMKTGDLVRCKGSKIYVTSMRYPYNSWYVLKAEGPFLWLGACGDSVLVKIMLREGTLAVCSSRSLERVT